MAIIQCLADFTMQDNWVNHAGFGSFGYRGWSWTCE